MVSTGNAVGRSRLASAVLVVLFFVSILQISPVDLKAARSKANTASATSCLGCCGANCQCAGDCCGDTHIATPASNKTLLTTSEWITPDRNCQKGSWLLPTANNNVQPWCETPRTVRVTPPRIQFRKSLEIVCWWRRPTISQSNPRGPPSPANHSSTV